MSSSTTGERPSRPPGAISRLGSPKQPSLDSKTNRLEEQGPVPSHILHAANPTVWDKRTPGKALNAQAGSLAACRSAVTCARRLGRERSAGPQSVRGIWGRAAAPASFWCLGRPDYAGPGHGRLTGPGESRSLEAKAEAHVWRSPRTGRRPRGSCPGGTSTSPPPNASSKVPSGPGLPVGRRETALGRAKARGRREGRSRGREPGGRRGPGRRPAGRRIWRGCGRREAGIPTGAARRGRRAFSVAPGPVASWGLLIYLQQCRISRQDGCF